jgi:hypothetical protein
MKKWLLLSSALTLCGCTALETKETQAWLALHAIDTAQTFRISQEPQCFAERDRVTSSLIGEHPSATEVLAWSVGMAGVHLGVTEWLLRNEHHKMVKAWQYIRIGTTVSAVARNHSIGIRIGSPNEPRDGSCIQRVPVRSDPALPIM